VSQVPVIRGTTRLYAILGDPIGKVRSPEHFNALMAARGVDAVLVPAEVAPADLASTVAGLKRVRNLGGLILTMPHKAPMVRLVDEVLESGRRVGAVNVVRREPDGRWVGDMFDGKGFVAGMRRGGHEPKARRVLQLGAGAVGCAIAFALAEAGVGSLAVHDVEPGRAQALVDRLAASYPQLELHVGLVDPATCELLLNATPVGMQDADPLPIDVSALPPRTVVADVITKPEITPFLAAARDRGCAVLTGRDMFEGQGELIASFFGWTAQG
jgi:shikimate dehydrogenase